MTFIFEVFNKSIALAVYKLQLGFGGFFFFCLRGSKLIGQLTDKQFLG